MGCKGSKSASDRDTTSSSVDDSNANTQSFKYIIIGGGNAAGYAAKEFVDQGIAKGQLLIISREAVPPYERPALSKGFLAKEKPARLPGFLTPAAEGGVRQDETWYRDHGIEFLPNTEVTAINEQDRSVETNTGKTFQYTKLIVATGAEVIALWLALESTPAKAIRVDFKDKDGEVFYLRDLKDAELLVEVMGKHRGEPVIVVGGGYIGTEVAAQLINNDLKVRFVFPGEHFMPRLFTPQISEVFKTAFTSRGAEFFSGMSDGIARNEDGSIKGLKLQDGTIVEGKFVVAGIGARTNLKLFGKLKIEAQGIRVNEHLQTSDPNIFAIGDIAAFPLIIENSELQRQEHVVNARQTARLAVQNILALEAGKQARVYDYLPFFYSRLFDFSWKFYGVNKGDVFHFGDFKEGGKFGALWVNNSRVSAVFLESGTDDENDKIKQLARDRPEAQSEDDVKSLIDDIFGNALVLSKL